MQQQAANRIVFVFPGQGSQSVGMLNDFAGAYETVARTFAEASAVLGYDLWGVTRNGPETELGRTEVTQPALLTAGVAIWRIWLEAGGREPAYLAGHSLGEYTALVCSGALRFTDAVGLVRDRGRYMQEAVPAGVGGMAAILGLDSAMIEKLCAEASTGETVSAANYNSPEQTVIAGHIDAVNRAVELCKAAGAKRAILLPVSVPSHCELMKTAAERLDQRMRTMAFESPRIPVLHNVDAEPRNSVDAVRAALVSQLYRPVRWVDTIARLADLQCRHIIETGPGKVLTGLNKRINKEIHASAIADPASLLQLINETKV